MGELYGGREAEIGRSLKNTSAGVKRSRIRRGFAKRHKDCGTSERTLGCLTVRGSLNSIFIQQSRTVLSSTLAVSFYIALVFLIVSAALFQGIQRVARRFPQPSSSAGCMFARMFAQRWVFPEWFRNMFRDFFF